MALLISTVKDKAGSAASLEEYDQFVAGNGQIAISTSESEVKHLPINPGPLDIDDAIAI